MNKKRNVIVIGMVCFVLTLGIAVQLKTIKNTNNIILETSENTELRDSAIKWKEKYDQSIANLENSENELKEIRLNATKDNPEAIEKENKLSENNMLLGLTDVEGPGIIITLMDNENATNESIGITEDIRDYLVHDANLREVIRKLKNSGAEAISINDQRLIFSTSVTCSGNVIRVNGVKVGSPFEIKAIGSPELLYGNLQATIRKLNNSGIIVNIDKQENINISKYSGTIKQDYAKSLE